MLDFSQCVLPPLEHQKVGVEAIVSHPFFFICDEMGMMKTGQVILAALFLYQHGVIDKVVVVCPAPVRSVWYDPELGELRRHLWPSVPVTVTEYHSRIRQWMSGPPSEQRLHIVVVNYEFIRSRNRLRQFISFCSSKTLLVLDESTAIKSHKSMQFKTCQQLRHACGRVVLLTGTPIANKPLDLFAQGNMLSPRILECPYITYFKARYAKTENVVKRSGQVLLTPYGKPVTKITGWQHLEDLQQRFAPYVLRRLKKDCLDLPPKLEPITLVAALSASWKAYVAMRDEMVVTLSSGDFSIAQQTLTKIMRLSQITSGFVGGIEDLQLDDLERDARDPAPIQEFGREKLDVLLEWLALRLEEDPSFKVLVGTRHRFELERAARELRALYPEMDVGEIRGNQAKDARQDALRLLDPRTAPAGPVAVLMTNAGSLGLNLTAAHHFFRLSRDFSLFNAQQADDRVHRPGQTMPVSYYDVLAEGPKGQATIDRVILTTVREKRDVADMTSSAWVKALTESE